jgi:hypothetical protein
MRPRPFSCYDRRRSSNAAGIVTHSVRSQMVTGIAAGLNKGFIVQARAKIVKPSNRKGVRSLHSPAHLPPATVDDAPAFSVAEARPQDQGCPRRHP